MTVGSSGLSNFVGLVSNHASLGLEGSFGESAEVSSPPVDNSPSLPFSPTETTAVTDEFTTTPVSIRTLQIDSVITQMKEGLLSGTDIFTDRLDSLYIFMAADEQAARVDWRDPTRTATAVDSPTFNEDVGFITDGASPQEVNTNFNPGDGGSYNFTQNSAHFGYWNSNSNAIAPGSSSGWFTSVGSTWQPRDGNNRLGVRLNQVGGTLVNGQTDAFGLHLITRDGASSTQIYKNAIQLTPNTNGNASSTPIPDDSLRLGRVTDAAYTSSECSMLCFGGALTSVEQYDLYNAIRIYDITKDNDDALHITKNSLHAVRNVWGPDGEHFVISGSNLLYVSDDGGANYTLTHTFADSPGRCYGLFMTSNNVLFVSLQDYPTGAEGRVWRSTDKGESFTQIQTFDASFESGNIAFWPMVEDSNGDLFCGQYNVQDPKVFECHVWKSTDEGLNWTDISPSAWTSTHHVHGLEIDVSNAWLYATIGDASLGGDGGGGLWRSKLKDGSDWIQKMTDGNYQYIPVVSRGNYMYLGDDQNDGSVSRFIDDGTSAKVTPTVVLSDPGSNCYWIGKDDSNNLYAALPPTDGSSETGIRGSLWYTLNGLNWSLIHRTPPMPYSEWADISGGFDEAKWALHTGTTQTRAGKKMMLPYYDENSIEILYTTSTGA